MSVHGKVILITGATGPTGRGLVHAFSRGEAKLALCVRQTSDLITMEQKLRGLASAPLILPCDLRNEDEVVRMVHRVAQHFGRIDVVVNAAAVVGPRAAVMDYPIDPWRNVIATNVTGAYLVCREVLPWMTRQGGGSIINVTSCVADSSQATGGAYLVSTYGVQGLTQLLAAEMAGSGVRVNLVEMGLLTEALEDESGEAPWAEAFLWLAGDAASTKSGERIRTQDFRRPN